MTIMHVLFDCGICYDWRTLDQYDPLLNQIKREGKGSKIVGTVGMFMALFTYMMIAALYSYSVYSLIIRPVLRVFAIRCWGLVMTQNNNIRPNQQPALIIYWVMKARNLVAWK